MDNKIKLTPFQYTSYWWVKRMKDFVDDVVKVGYSTDEGVKFTQFFDCLEDEHWRALYLRLTPMIEDEFNRTGSFVQSTASTLNSHYLGHNKINEMLKSIIHINIPNATLNPTGMRTKTVSIHRVKNETSVYSFYDHDADKIIVKENLNVEKDYILTGDKSLLPTNKTL